MSRVFPLDPLLGCRGGGLSVDCCVVWPVVRVRGNAVVGPRLPRPWVFRVESPLAICLRCVGIGALSENSGPWSRVSCSVALWVPMRCVRWLLLTCWPGSCGAAASALRLVFPQCSGGVSRGLTPRRVTIRAVYVGKRRSQPLVSLVGVPLVLGWGCPLPLESWPANSGTMTLRSRPPVFCSCRALAGFSGATRLGVFK